MISINYSLLEGVKPAANLGRQITASDGNAVKVFIAGDNPSWHQIFATRRFLQAFFCKTKFLQFIAQTAHFPFCQ